MRKVTLKDMRGPQFVRLWTHAAEGRARLLSEGLWVRAAADVHPAHYPRWEAHLYWRYRGASNAPQRSFLCMETLTNSVN